MRNGSIKPGDVTCPSPPLLSRTENESPCYELTANKLVFKSFVLKFHSLLST